MSLLWVEWGFDEVDRGGCRVWGLDRDGEKGDVEGVWIGKESGG